MKEIDRKDLGSGCAVVVYEMGEKYLVAVHDPSPLDFARPSKIVTTMEEVALAIGNFLNYQPIT